MFVALDSILIFGMALALVIGLARSWSGWRTRREHSETGDWVGLLEYLFFNRSIARKPVVGWAHYILVLGFVVFLAVVFLDQADGLLSTLQATVVSFILDLLGFLMLMAVVFFLVKKARDRFQPSPAVMARKSLLTISLIGLIVITGFLSEGARLAIQNEGFDLSAPFGSVVAGLLTDSPVLMQVFIRAHIYLVILFIGTLPFTYMRHIASSAVGILHRTEKTSFPPPKLMERDQLERAEGVENIKWKVFLGVEACVSCGRCIENCPATIAEKPLVPGAIVQQVRERAEQAHLTGKSIVDIIPPDIAWSCTNCLACIEHCPVYSRPMDLISLSRRQLVLGQGEIPEEARAMIRNLELYGDTNGKGAAYRNDWAIGLDIEQLTSINPETDVLLWTGCAGAFHPRASEVTRSLVKILKSAEIDVKILGEEETCCGDPAKRLGDEDLFARLAGENIKTLNQFKFNRIVTLCPHCAHTLKTDYETMGAEFSVVHATELVAELIATEKLKLKYSPKEKAITIHDPCYLGRAAGVYQPLRDICQSMAGVDVKEMPRNRESAFCCGTGGGRMWLHENLGRNINMIRAEEAFELEVDQVATACPYCLTMFEDGLGGIEADVKPKVNDLIEMVVACLE